MVGNAETLASVSAAVFVSEWKAADSQGKGTGNETSNREIVKKKLKEGLRLFIFELISTSFAFFRGESNEGFNALRATC